MEQRNLNERFDALQDQILSIYEEESTDLNTQLTHWKLCRRSYATQYFARKHGYKSIGMMPLPSLAASEANGKKAIEMTLLIESLLKSPFAGESWTLQDTSAELVLYTAPHRTFKKLPYTVNVWFDNDAENAFPYVNYKLLYVKDDNEQWYKAEGQTDYTGMFYIDAYGDKAYYKLFGEDSQTYGSSGMWSVHFNNTTLLPPASSSRPSAGSSNIIIIDSDDEELPSTSSEGQHTDPGQAIPGLQYTFQSEEEAQGAGRQQTESPKKTGVRRPGQREGQREPGSPPVKKAKADSSGGGQRRGARGGGIGGGGGRRRSGRGSAPTAAEVGGRHTSVTEGRLTRLERLQEEARDPAVISVEGPANSLKCWRYRFRKYCDLYEEVSTVFKWLSNKHGASKSHIMISFKSETQRQKFLNFVTIPKNCNFAYGHLDAL